MQILLPPGRYLAQLVRRKTLPKDERGGVEFTFCVAHGEYAGELVSMRLWASGRIERADSLRQGDSVEIVVSHRDAASGKRFATVHDFKRHGALTAADAVRGEDEALHRASADHGRIASGTFRPHPLLTEDELEDALWSIGGETDQPIPFPLLADDTASNVLRAARSSSGQPPVAIEDAPDFSEADDDAADYCWSITRYRKEAPESIRLVSEENPPPLPVVPENAKGPVQVSLFRYTPDLPSYMTAHRQSLRGYSGLAAALWLPIRLLAVDDLAEIHEQARLVATTCVRLGVPREQIIAVNNWNLGLSLFIPACTANAVPQVGYEKVAGHFAQAIADLACMETLGVPMKEAVGGLMMPRDPRSHARIDRQLYGPVAVHPAINSPDELGKLYAVAMSFEELMSLEADKIEELAGAPGPVPRPTWRANEVGELVSLWEYAVQAERLRSKRFSWLTCDDQFVHADTYDLMLHGTDTESASKRLFRAAMNLLRLGCSQNAVVALLHPAAHLSGLDREDVTWGVKCAATDLVPEGFYFDDE